MRQGLFACKRCFCSRHHSQQQHLRWNVVFGVENIRQQKKNPHW